MQTPDPERNPAPRVVPALERLLEQGRITEALELLRAAQRERPKSRAIKRGIEMLESRLLKEELHTLGDLRRIPRLGVGAAALGTLPPEELGLAVKVDGISSLGDLIDLPGRAGSTRLDAVRRLGGLLRRGVIEVAGTTPRTEEPTAPGGRKPRPMDCDKTAQIAVVPEAQAMLARARRARIRPTTTKTTTKASSSRSWMVACLCIWLGGAAAAASYRYSDVVTAAVQSAVSWVSNAI